MARTKVLPKDPKKANFFYFVTEQQPAEKNRDKTSSRQYDVISDVSLDYVVIILIP